MLEKDVVRDQTGHRHHGPAGAGEQPFVELIEIRDARAGQAQHVQPLVESMDGAVAEHLLLAREEYVPDAVFLWREPLPALRDRPVRRRAGWRDGRGGRLGAICDQLVGQHGVLQKRKTPPEELGRGGLYVP